MDCYIINIIYTIKYYCILLHNIKYCRLTGAIGYLEFDRIERGRCLYSIKCMSVLYYLNFEHKD